MLTESELVSRITEGESETLDLKREINLELAEHKAEFVKDVLSIANSASEAGYLIVGVDDSGCIVGTTRLEEERMQQITRTYITPPISLNCSTVHLPSAGENVGIVRIIGHEKPHKVARSIGRLNQDDVFVRHGSVVVRASPEEIIRLSSDTKAARRCQRYIRAANVSIESGRIEHAIEYYSKALTLIPSAEGFVLRGQAYCEWANQRVREIDQRTGNKGFYRYLDAIEDTELRKKEEEALKSIRDSRDSCAKMALEDFSEAVIVADTPEAEKRARMLRLELVVNTDYGPRDTLSVWEEDLNWLKSHTKDGERARVLHLEVKWLHVDNAYFTNSYDRALLLMDEIIQLGHDDIEIYYMRAMAHSGAFNYGLALLDVKKALSMATNPREALPIYLEYAFTLSNMGEYEKLFGLFQEMQPRYSKRDIDGYVRCSGNIVEEILLRYAIDFEFTELDEVDIRLGQQIVRIFKSWHTSFGKQHPEAARIIQKLLVSGVS